MLVHVLWHLLNSIVHENYNKCNLWVGAQLSSGRASPAEFCKNKNQSVRHFEYSDVESLWLGFSEFTSAFCKLAKFKVADHIRNFKKWSLFVNCKHLFGSGLGFDDWMIFFQMARFIERLSRNYVIRYCLKTVWFEPAKNSSSLKALRK